MQRHCQILISATIADVGQLQSAAFAAVCDEHDHGNGGGTEGCEAKDEHRGGVGGVLLVSPSYEHGDDGASEVLDEEYHGEGRTQAFQGNNLWYAGP